MRAGEVVVSSWETQRKSMAEVWQEAGDWCGGDEV